MLHVNLKNFILLQLHISPKSPFWKNIFFPKPHFNGPQTIEFNLSLCILLVRFTCFFSCYVRWLINNYMIWYFWTLVVQIVYVALSVISRMLLLFFYYVNYVIWYFFESSCYWNSVCYIIIIVISFWTSLHCLCFSSSC